MDTENDDRGEAQPNWAYPLLRIVVVGAVLEITCVSVMTVYLWLGLVPRVLEPVVHCFIFGAAVAGCWAICSLFLYLCFRPGLSQESDLRTENQENSFQGSD